MGLHPDYSIDHCNYSRARKPNTKPTCLYNPEISCNVQTKQDPRCKRCGWNPEVAEKRRDRVREEHTHNGR